MREIRDRFINLLNEEDGATAIEYALIASAVGVALAATMPSLQSSLTSTYSDISGYFSSS